MPIFSIYWYIAAAVSRALAPVSNMKSLLQLAPTAPVVSSALQFTISQAGIAAQTLTLM